MRNGVVLITYADSFGGDLSTLRSSLGAHFRGCISGIHLLPFFPSSGDRGFSPVTYDRIDPAFGSWEDLGRLGDDYEIMADFMVNHISRKSAYFLDWTENGDRSPYAELFLPVSRIFGTETPDADELAKIYRRQPREPWIKVRFSSGAERNVWCTFSEQQIDIDIASGAGLTLFEEVLAKLSAKGIKTVRLDAVGYIVKKRGTSCFMVEPEIWETLGRLKERADRFGIELLPEMHEHYSIQLRMAEHGYPVYDFALPLLLLYSWYAGDFAPLKHWLSICPENQYTTLDTHDGIGVVDAADLLTEEQMDFTVEKLYEKGSNINRKYSSAEYNNLDIYQINCTYYSALGENDDAYIAARAIQFFAPGIPQVYYTGLLAGRNDLNLVEKTRNGRDINRHSYTADEIKTESERPVVRRLKELMRFRMNCPAFGGSFSIENTDSRLLLIRRSDGTESAELRVDISQKMVTITHTDPEGKITRVTP